MYKMIKDVLEAKGYNLAEITNKIEKRCLENKITEAERDELLILANQNASADNEKASTDNQFKAIFKNLEEMATRIKSLEAEIAKLKGEEVTPEETEEYPEWEKWDGIGTIPYQTDSKVTHNGVKYISQVDNNIWEPGVPGVYENIWKIVEETE